MKVIFYPGESQVEFEMEEPTIDSFQPCIDKPHETDPHAVIKEPVGDKIMLITSNMPKELKQEMVRMVRDHCNL